MELVKPVPYQEALDKLGRETVRTSGLTSSQWRDVPLALRENAFFSSRVENARFLQRARDSINGFVAESRETLDNGQVALKTGSRAQFVRDMQQFAVAEGMGPVDPKDSGTIKDIRSQKRLELIFDTKTRQAHDYGYWKQGQDPDILDEFPAQRFIRIQPVKEPRDYHIQFEDQVRLKSDVAFWTIVNQDFGVPWGPWGWGCGHDVEDVARDEAESLGLLTPDQAVEPATEQMNERLEASTQNLDPDLLDMLRTAFGDQVEIRDDSIQWVPTPTTPPVAAPPLFSPPAPHASTPAAPVQIPAPLPLDPVAPQVRQHPVSAAVQNTTKGKVAKAVEHAMATIDLVHDDGTLAPIKVGNKVSAGSEGTYYRGGGYIGVRRTKPIHPEMTFTHEVGHWLDEQALPGTGFSSVSHLALEPWRQAIHASKAVLNLKTKPGYQDDPGYLRYLLRPQELWARSYAQYIADRSKDVTLSKQIADVVQGNAGGYFTDSQWSEADFAPIRGAIDGLFKTLGWL